MTSSDRQRENGADVTDAEALAIPDLTLFALRRATNAVMLDYQSSIGSDDIRPAAYAVLSLLRHRPGLRQSQLSPVLGIRRTNLVPLLADLEKQGFAERRPVPGDRRAAALYITQAGASVLARCEDAARRHEENVAAKLGPGGRAALLKLLQQLAGAGSSLEIDSG